MKLKHFPMTLLALTLSFSGCKYDDSSLWDEVNSLDSRLTAVEQTLSEINQNVGQLRGILHELEADTRIVDYRQTSTGYTITFSDGNTIMLNNGSTPMIGENGNWWINGKDTGKKAVGVDGSTPYIGENGNWFVGNKDTGIKAQGRDGESPVIIDGYWWVAGKNTGVKAAGQSPTIGNNGNWWFAGIDTGVRAAGDTPYIGENGNWFIGDKDTGVKAAGVDGINGRDGRDGKDGADGLTPYIKNGNWWVGSVDTGMKAVGDTPYIGGNGNWFIGDKDTGVKAVGVDGTDGRDGTDGTDGANGLTPYIKNGNWWIGDEDTGCPATGQSSDTPSSPIIGIKIDVDNIYYWTITINGVEDWLYDDNHNKISCSGIQPIFRTDYENHLQYSLNYGITWSYVLNEYGEFVNINSCHCTQFFQGVYVEGNYFYLVLMDGTVIRFRLENDERGGIPDDPVTPIPDPKEPNTPIPNPGGSYEIDEWGNCVYSMSLSGITDNSGGWLRLAGTGESNQNVWIDVDGNSKGILVINLEDNTIRMKNDIVFSVDNSGSMSEEADAVARDILEWAEYLDKGGLDVQFAVAGYDGGLTGARNFCSASELSSYLNNNGSGTNRTYHFGGSDASALMSAASNYNNGYHECGANAIQYAHNNFKFRTGSNRIYVNFTDEPNQPNGNSAWSVDFFASQTNWPSQYGTIHSVYSDTYTTYSQTKGYTEYPWLMSDYTGGTKMFTDGSFKEVTLKKLPVSDALMHSYTIKFIIPLAYLDGKPHTLTLVVISTDGMTRGKLVLTNFVFGLYR